MTTLPTTHIEPETYRRLRNLLDPTSRQRMADVLHRLTSLPRWTHDDDQEVTEP
ncbi:hypothetical protein [Micromonospora arborensis]|uniref:hypothetical protein n=1 Tax=Micromonospora arborensis TaxID=2116518 RepID=UPI00142D7398|nr:hypothetical protein [Micromonospora arborensis]